KTFGMPSLDGKLIAMFAPNTSAVTIYDASNGRTLQTLTPANSSSGVERVYFSPDGHSLAVTYMISQGVQMIGRLPSSELKIWDVTTGHETQTLTLSTSPVEARFSSDGKSLATVSTQGEITLWDVASGSRLRSFTSSPGQNFNPLANMGNFPMPQPGKRPNMKNMPQIANMPNMADLSAMMTNMLGTMTAGTMGRSVTSVAFSPDGKILASGGVESKSNFDLATMMGQATGNQKRSKNQPPPSPEDFMKNLKVETIGQVVFWNPETGQQLGAIKGHGKGITDVVFSRDAKMIASAGTDNTIKLWDVGTQRELRTLTGHTANIESMDFSPDGKLLASAGDDGSTLLWDTNTGEHLLTLISLDDGGEWIVVTPEGLFDGTPQSWNQIPGAITRILSTSRPSNGSSTNSIIRVCSQTSSRANVPTWRKTSQRKIDANRL
ncbi:MAG TPA: WD40 repeat domain-containing protein, partial [Pyrinomonadaceae bacterium]